MEQIIIINGFSLFFFPPNKFVQKSNIYLWYSTDRYITTIVAAAKKHNVFVWKKQLNFFFFFCKQQSLSSVEQLPIECNQPIRNVQFYFFFIFQNDKTTWNFQLMENWKKKKKKIWQRLERRKKEKKKKKQKKTKKKNRQSNGRKLPFISIFQDEKKKPQ